MKYKKWFSESVEFLWKNRKDLAEKYTHKNEPDYEMFDYPDYAGMPKKLSRRLSGDFVDVVQSVWSDLLDDNFKTKNKFIKELLDAPMWNPLDCIK